MNGFTYVDKDGNIASSAIDNTKASDVDISAGKVDSFPDAKAVKDFLVPAFEVLAASGWQSADVGNLTHNSGKQFDYSGGTFTRLLTDGTKEEFTVAPQTPISWQHIFKDGTNAGAITSDIDNLNYEPNEDQVLVNVAGQNAADTNDGTVHQWFLDPVTSQFYTQYGTQIYSTTNEGTYQYPQYEINSSNMLDNVFMAIIAVDEDSTTLNDVNGRLMPISTNSGGGTDEVVLFKESVSDLASLKAGLVPVNGETRQVLSELPNVVFYSFNTAATEGETADDATVGFWNKLSAESGDWITVTTDGEVLEVGKSYILNNNNAVLPNHVGNEGKAINVWNDNILIGGSVVTLTATLINRIDGSILTSTTISQSAIYTYIATTNGWSSGWDISDVSIPITDPTAANVMGIGVTYLVTTTAPGAVLKLRSVAFGSNSIILSRTSTHPLTIEQFDTGQPGIISNNGGISNATNVIIPLSSAGSRKSFIGDVTTWTLVEANMPPSMIHVEISNYPAGFDLSQFWIDNGIQQGVALQITNTNGSSGVAINLDGSKNLVYKSLSELGVSTLALSAGFTLSPNGVATVSFDATTVYATINSTRDFGFHTDETSLSNINSNSLFTGGYAHIGVVSYVYDTDSTNPDGIRPANLPPTGRWLTEVQANAPSRFSPSETITTASQIRVFEMPTGFGTGEYASGEDYQMIFNGATPYTPAGDVTSSTLLNGRIAEGWQVISPNTPAGNHPLQTIRITDGWNPSLFRDSLEKSGNYYYVSVSSTNQNIDLTNFTSRFEIVAGTQVDILPATTVSIEPGESIRFWTQATGSVYFIREATKIDAAAPIADMVNSKVYATSERFFLKIPLDFGQGDYVDANGKIALEESTVLAQYPFGGTAPADVSNITPTDYILMEAVAGQRSSIDTLSRDVSIASGGVHQITLDSYTMLHSFGSTPTDSVIMPDLPMTYLGAGNERHGKIFNYSGFDINVNLPAGHFWLFDFDDRAIANGGQLVLPKDGIMYWRGATNTQFDGYIIQGGGLRLAPVADLTELSILAASEYNQVLVKSNLSEYVFKPTADLSAPENADASNLVDNAGTGKWVVKNAGLISVPDFLVNEINNTPITIPNYAPIEQITFVWKDRRDGIGNNVGDARRLTEVWSPVNLTGALTVHPGWTQSGGAVTSTFTKTISLNSQPYEFTVFITHTVAGFRILVHDQHAATVNTYGGWEAIVEYEQTYSVNGLAISNGSGAAGQTLQSNGDGTATWV